MSLDTNNSTGEVGNFESMLTAIHPSRLCVRPLLRLGLCGIVPSSWRRLEHQLGLASQVRQCRSGGRSSNLYPAVNRIVGYQALVIKATGKVLCLTVEAATSFTAAKVTKVMVTLFAARSTPKYLRSDDGPEFMARSPAIWLKVRGTASRFTKPETL